MKKIISIMLVLLLFLTGCFALTACKDDDDDNDDNNPQQMMSDQKVKDVVRKVALDAESIREHNEQAAVSYLQGLSASADDKKSYTSSFEDYFTMTKEEATQNQNNYLYTFVMGACYSITTMDDFRQDTVYKDELDMFEMYKNECFVRISSDLDKIMLDLAVRALDDSGNTKFVQYMHTKIYPENNDYTVNVNGIADYSEFPDYDFYTYVASSAKSENGVLTEKLSVEINLNSATINTESEVDAAQIIDSGEGNTMWGYMGDMGISRKLKAEDTDIKDIAKMVIVELGTNFDRYNSFKTNFDNPADAKSVIKDWYDGFVDSMS